MAKQVSKNNPKLLSEEEAHRCQEGELLKEVARQKGWVEVLQPHLDSFLHHSWVNPRSCKDLKQFGWQELQRADYAQFVKELFDWMEQIIQSAVSLRKKEKGELEEDKFREIFTKEVKT